MTTQVLTPTTQNSLLLKNALRGNAIFSTLSGLLLALDANLLSKWLGVESPIALRVIGVGLLLFAVFLFTNIKDIKRRILTGKIAIAADLLWVVGSFALIFSGWLPLTNAGTWAIAIIADIVLLFAIVQYIGLRRQQK